MTIPAANARTVAPAAMRTRRWWRLNAETRSVTRRPARAKARRGIAVPAAKESARATVSAPMRPVEPATITAASTGPAQGT